MEINKINSNAINSYKAIKNVKVSGSGDSEKKTGGNFDKVEFDFAQSMNSAKVNMSNKLSDDVDAVKIQMLKAAYAGDTCPVSPEQIAQAIFGG